MIFSFTDCLLAFTKPGEIFEGQPQMSANALVLIGVKVKHNWLTGRAVTLLAPAPVSLLAITKLGFFPVNHYREEGVGAAQMDMIVTVSFTCSKHHPLVGRCSRFELGMLFHKRHCQGLSLVDESFSFPRFSGFGGGDSDQVYFGFLGSGCSTLGGFFLGGPPISFFSPSPFGAYHSFSLCSSHLILM